MPSGSIVVWQPLVDFSLVWSFMIFEYSISRIIFSVCFCIQVDDVVSRVHDLDISSLRSQLGPLAAVSSKMIKRAILLCSFKQEEMVCFVYAKLSVCISCQILLCIDVAASSSRSAKMSQQLLNQVI